MSTIREMADAVQASGDFGAAVMARLERIKDADAAFERDAAAFRSELDRMAQGMAKPIAPDVQP